LYKLGRHPDEIARVKADNEARKLIQSENDKIEKKRVAAIEKLRKANLSPEMRKAEAKAAKEEKKQLTDTKNKEKSNKLAAAHLRLAGSNIYSYCFYYYYYYYYYYQYRYIIICINGLLFVLLLLSYSNYNNL